MLGETELQLEVFFGGLAADVGDRLGEGDLFGTDLHAVLRLATL